MKELLKRKLRQIPWAYQGWSKLRYASRDSRLLTDVNGVGNTASRKRAILSYLVSPFLTDKGSSTFFAHQNQWASVEIARILGRLGYVVDVINWNNFDVKIDRTYDLIIGFGRAEKLAEEHPVQTVKIYIATGSEAHFINERERARVEEINRRRGCNLEVVRKNPDKSEYLQYFDAIACIGNAVTMSTYQPYFQGLIYPWNNHGFDHWFGLAADKDFEKSRRHFLYFSGSGQVLIGLDLVLGAFVKRPELTLSVCGPFANEKNFARCFHKELYETPNIKPIGWVTVGGVEYFNLMRQCGATIFPICAGASPGSVINCMSQGIIPIVSKEAGIDTADFGFTLEYNTVEDIGQVVDFIADQSAQWHADMSQKVLEASQRDFSQAAFTRRFTEILTTVIQEKIALGDKRFDKL